MAEEVKELINEETKAEETTVKTDGKEKGKVQRKKGFRLLIVGLVLVLGSAIFAVYARQTSYQQSKIVGQELSSVKSKISSIEAGKSEGNLESLKKTSESLAEEKLSLERPYSFSVTLLFLALALLIKGLYNAFVGVHPSQALDTKRLALAGFMAALCYIGFAFFKIDIPVGTEKTAFHLGNVFCVLAALLLGGYLGGLAGAVGMTIGDLTTSYVTSAPKTFLLKLLIGLIVGLVAHKIFKLSRAHSAKFVTGVTILASICGMLFNVFADPTVGYFYKIYVLGIPQEVASIFAKWTALTTFVNAIVAVICASVFYLALRPALKKSGLFPSVSAEEEA
ncbi:MAG: ECF transporter S component [Lachnospiraceae bacterium]|nr:ECF transporter S component [Lachnospiraceae bacterium]